MKKWLQEAYPHLGFIWINKTKHRPSARPRTDYSGVWISYWATATDHDSSNGKALGWEKNGFVKVRVDALDPAVWGVERWLGWWGGGGLLFLSQPDGPIFAWPPEGALQ